ncbi:hypothetical protein BH23CHL10_BH23CHL10_07330 [soil metagenome]
MDSRAFDARPPPIYRCFDTSGAIHVTDDRYIGGYPVARRRTNLGEIGTLAGASGAVVLGAMQASDQGVHDRNGHLRMLFEEGRELPGRQEQAAGLL